MKIITTQAALPFPVTTMHGNSSEPCPALLVVPEIWGLDDHMHDVMRRVAEAGYLAAGADLYALSGARPAELGPERIATAKDFLETVPPSAWHNQQERDVLLARMPAPQQAPIRQTLGALLSPQRPMAAMTAALRTTAGWLREQPKCSGKLGAMGFCMGGSLVSLLAASEPHLHAGVIFYGAGPPVEQVNNVSCPLMAHHGAADARLMASLPAFTAAMAAAHKSLLTHVYEDAPHAFFNDQRPSYRVEAARLSWARTLMFCADHLS